MCNFLANGPRDETKIKSRGNFIKNFISPLLRIYFYIHTELIIQLHVRLNRNT